MRLGIGTGKTMAFFFNFVAISFFLYHLVRLIMWAVLDSDIELFFLSKLGRPICKLTAIVMIALIRKYDVSNTLFFVFQPHFGGKWYGLLEHPAASGAIWPLHWPGKVLSCAFPHVTFPNC